MLRRCPVRPHGAGGGHTGYLIADADHGLAGHCVLVLVGVGVCLVGGGGLVHRVLSAGVRLLAGCRRLLLWGVQIRKAEGLGLDGVISVTEPGERRRGVRKGGGGDVLETGGGWLGPPSSGSPYGPRQRRAKTSQA